MTIFISLSPGVSRGKLLPKLPAFKKNIFSSCEALFNHLITGTCFTNKPAGLLKKFAGESGHYMKNLVKNQN